MLDRLLEALAQRRPLESSSPDRPQAAVALVLAPDPDQLLLIRRADRTGDPWSGHLALPGGRRQEADRDLLTTAIRETAEETGVQLERQACRAQLDDLVPQIRVLPPIMVRPFLFRLPDAVVARQSDEVVEASWVALADLTAAGVYGERSVAVGGVTRSVWGYDLPAGIVWGMTERILTPVLDLWRESGGKLRGGGGRPS